MTELVDGEDLKTAIRRRGPWPSPEAADLGATLAEALAAAHAQGVVHRDVKPNNVMIASDGSVRLLDFGLARGAGIDLATLTRTGTILGTPGYMSPEQFDAHGVDERSDLYSLGVVLFEVLTGGCRSPARRRSRWRSPTRPRRRLCRAPFGPGSPPGSSASSCAASRRTPRGASPARPRWRRTSGGPGKVPPRERSLPSGDGVLLDPGETTDWALVLTSTHEKTGWAEGMALHFEERHYRLVRVQAPASPGAPWTYRSTAWPEGAVFRRLVDYERDLVAREEEASRKLTGRLPAGWPAE